MTSFADLKIWMPENQTAIMPVVMFKSDVEEAFELKLSDEQWAIVVERVENYSDDVRETVFELVRNEVKFCVNNGCLLMSGRRSIVLTKTIWLRTRLGLMVIIKGVCLKLTVLNERLLMLNQ